MQLCCVKFVGDCGIARWSGGATTTLPFFISMQDILGDWQNAAGSFQKVYPHEYRRAIEQMKAEQEQEELLATHGATDALAALKAASEAASKDNVPEHSYLDYLPPTPEVRTFFLTQMTLLYQGLFVACTVVVRGSCYVAGAVCVGVGGMRVWCSFVAGGSVRRGVELLWCCAVMGIMLLLDRTIYICWV